MHQPDAAALVAAHVQHHAAALAGHHRQRGVQLRAAVAAAGSEHVTGQALGVHPHQHVMPVAVRPGDVATDQRDVLDLVVDAGVADRAELAVPGRDAGLGDALDVLLVLAAPLDQVGDGDQREVVLVGEDPQLVGLRHRAFVLLADDFADRARRLQAGHPGQVDGGLGVAGPAQHPAVLGAQRNDVAGPGEVVGDAGRVGEQPHRGGAVGRRDSGADAIFRVDGDGVGGAVLVLVHRVHRQQAELVADRAVQRHAQVARGVADHERDELGGGLLGGEDEVALVLPVLVIDDDDGLTRRDVGNRPFDGVQPRHHRHPCRFRSGTIVAVSSMNHDEGAIIASRLLHQQGSPGGV